MSVIVKGMEMPENCGGCRFIGSCGVLGNEEWPDIESIMFNDVIGIDGKRDKDCPLRPLPEKHGRLGDLDELKTSFADSINECKKWIKELEENGDNETLPLANQAFCTFVEAALRLKSIPTIVEAEGE